MSKYIITVTDTQPRDYCATEVTISTVPATQEVFKLAVDEFDPLTFCAALKQRTRGRKPGKKEESK